jgi:hypothetical protein
MVLLFSEPAATALLWKLVLDTTALAECSTQASCYRTRTETPARSTVHVRTWSELPTVKPARVSRVTGISKQLAAEHMHHVPQQSCIGGNADPTHVHMRADTPQPTCNQQSTRCTTPMCAAVLHSNWFRSVILRRAHTKQVWPRSA